MLDVYTLLKFDNLDGGVWKQGFDITYEPEEWDKEPLQVFVVFAKHFKKSIQVLRGFRENTLLLDPFLMTAFRRQSS